jgi:gluconokinase
MTWRADRSSAGWAGRLITTSRPGAMWRTGPAELPSGDVTVTAVVVMGVSGSGKTTVAVGLARRLGWPFEEGDDHHPVANVAKMRAGIPLDDADREPWLRTLAGWISDREREGTSSVLTCSALKRRYRDLLRAGNDTVLFVHVDVPEEVLRERLARRTGHYMPPSLLDSQLATLEPLADDEPGLTVPGTGTPAEVVDAVVDALPQR